MSFHYILHNDQMNDLYWAARGYEPYSIRFWNPLFNQDFLFADKWIVAPEQLVQLDSRRGRGRVDTVVEHFHPVRKTHAIMMIHEAKREKENAKDLEHQVKEYGEAILTGRMLGQLYVITTIGTTFRTWHMNHSNKSLDPLFGGQGGTSKEYIDASTQEGGIRYQEFVMAVKAAAHSPQAPTLPSTAGPAHPPGPPSSSDDSMDTTGGPAETDPAPPEQYTFGTGTWGKGSKNMYFEWYEDDGTKQNLKTLASNWTLDENNGHLVWYSKTWKRWFACSKPF
ncbi:hypothetical protein MY4824_008150 [Beauveria thailandica]